MVAESDRGTLAEPSAPIACSLSADSLHERLDEWRALVADSVVSVDGEAGSVRLVLHDSDEALLAAASLGAREKECCPFFDVTIELEPDRRVLRLAVPPDAEPVLAEFVRALRP